MQTVYELADVREPYIIVDNKSAWGPMQGHRRWKCIAAR